MSMLFGCGAEKNGDDIGEPTSLYEKVQTESEVEIESETELETTEENRNETVSESSYTNDALKLSFTLPKGWRFVSEEEIAEMNQTASEQVGSEYKDYFENAPQLYEMFADDGYGNSVGVLVEDATDIKPFVEKNGIGFVLEARKESIVKMMESMGATNIVYEITDEKFPLQGEYAIVKTSYELNEVPFYQRLISTVIDNNYYSISSTIIGSDEGTSAIFDAFSALE